MNYSSSMYKKLNQVIVKHPEDAFLSQKHLEENWEKYNYAEMPNYEEALKEYKEFLRILENNVSDIKYLPASDKVGLDSIYAHDPIKFTNKGAILLKSGKTVRQPETTIYKEFLQENEIPIIGELTGDAEADGGDIVWINDRVLAVGRGYRTNAEGIRQLKEITKDLVDEFIVVELPHDQGKEECLHLMSLISIVDKDLAVVYSPLMAVSFRENLIEKGFTLIEVSAEENISLGGNVLALAPRVCMIVEGNERIKAALEENGATVYSYKGQEISYKGTGGPTCLTSPVIRG